MKKRNTWNVWYRKEFPTPEINFGDWHKLIARNTPTPEINFGEWHKLIVGNVQALFEHIEEKIANYYVTDETLEEWAKQLVSAIYESDEIGEELESIVTSILKKESACNIRSHRKDGEVTHKKIMLARWQNLRIFVSRAFSPFSLNMENLSKDVLRYCEEIGLIQPQCESEPKRAFRLKYGEYIADMDAFFESLDTTGAKTLKVIFDKSFAKSDFNFREFFDDCTAIVPWRRGQRGWNYHNARR